MTDSALSDYRQAFSHEEDRFITYWSINKDKSLKAAVYTRWDFWLLARKAATVLKDRHIGQGDCFCLYSSANTVEDLAFRMAASMLGAIPVTINWQADTPERVLYKMKHTDSKLLVVDEGVDAAPDGVPSYCSAELAEVDPISEQESWTSAGGQASFGRDRTRIIIFTSGTTGEPKGVKLSYANYACNRSTFESFLCVDDAPLVPIVVNPLHHTNSTAITDWALRRPHTHLHLIQRYSTKHWECLADICESSPEGARLPATMVSRHFDFLSGLDTSGKLPTSIQRISAALNKLDVLLGSAPVGPTTVKRLQLYAQKLPLVRFGSTETCLQVVGTPYQASQAERLLAFQKGWEHTWNGETATGYYIGQSHPPMTEVKFVVSKTKTSPDYMRTCKPGEPGFLVTRGGHIMKGYVKDDEATSRAMASDGWYTNLGDIGFYLETKQGKQDIYWQTRDSALLIRGGANYAYEQINSELAVFVQQRYGLGSEDVSLAVVGLRGSSEHEDDCVLTISLNSELARSKRSVLQHIVHDAKNGVSKGSRPDFVRFAELPRNFKGALLVPQLKTDCLEALSVGSSAASASSWRVLVVAVVLAIYLKRRVSGPQ